LCIELAPITIAVAPAFSSRLALSARTLAARLHSSALERRAMSEKSRLSIKSGALARWPWRAWTILLMCS